jgi:phosphoribosyl 1,2-cyclic phosphodiesterase
MKIEFLGTRGEIEPKTRRHNMHTSLLLTHKGKRVMIDCGTTWLKGMKKVKPDQIILTHAHPDHAFGLKNGAPCPVWATEETWKLIDKFPIPKQNRKLIIPHKKHRICGIQFEAFPLLHSIRCPAVGYRITSGKTKLFYSPDVAWILEIEKAFQGIQFYIGDGATIVRNMIRRSKETDEIFGHATIRQQLNWCKKMKVPKMIITHCGSAIVSGEEKAQKQIAKLSRERKVDFLIACDGLKL